MVCCLHLHSLSCWLSRGLIFSFWNQHFPCVTKLGGIQQCYAHNNCPTNNEKNFLSTFLMCRRSVNVSGSYSLPSGFRTERKHLSMHMFNNFASIREFSSFRCKYYQVNRTKPSYARQSFFKFSCGPLTLDKFSRFLPWNCLIKGFFNSKMP